MASARRRFVPGAVGFELELRLPLDGDFDPAGAWAGPIEIQVPPVPPDAAPPDPPAPAAPEVAPDDDPFEHSFAPAEDNLPDGPAPPHSACPAFPPDE